MFFSWEGKGQLEGGDVYIVYREVNEIFVKNIINNYYWIEFCDIRNYQR